MWNRQDSHQPRLSLGLPDAARNPSGASRHLAAPTNSVACGAGAPKAVAWGRQAGNGTPAWTTSVMSYPRFDVPPFYAHQQRMGAEESLGSSIVRDAVFGQGTARASIRTDHPYMSDSVWVVV